MSHFQVVICDIDGCLSPEDPVPMDYRLLADIAEHNVRAKNEGDRPLLTLCSGRPLPFVEALCRYLQNDRVPCIGENGVWMYDPGENLYLLDPAITDEHLEIVRTATDWARRTYEPQGVSQQPAKNASLTLHHPDTQYLRRVCEEVKGEFEQRGWPFRVSMTWSYINCDLTHISKATGIRRFFEKTGLSSEDCAGIGDTLSDQAIATSVRYFACPANAAKELDAFADYRSPYAETEGVLDILRRL